MKRQVARASPAALRTKPAMQAAISWWQAAAIEGMRWDKSAPLPVRPSAGRAPLPPRGLPARQQLGMDTYMSPVAHLAIQGTRRVREQRASVARLLGGCPMAAIAAACDKGPSC